MTHPHEPTPGTRLAELSVLKAKGSLECVFGPPEEPFHLVIFAREGGVCAFENRCPHFSIPLNYEPGLFWVYDDSVLMCAHHSAMFHLDDGVCFDGPCQGAALHRVSVEVRDGAIYSAKSELDAGWQAQK
jgi:nitrite reductase/ring-hydroxylating ferredoxin subunit